MLLGEWFKQDGGTASGSAKFNLKLNKTMARTTIKVELPAGKPDDFVKLIEDILAEHDKREAATPGSSPIPGKYITPLRALLASAKKDRGDAKNLAAQSQQLFEKSAKTLGLGAGQTSRSEGTGFNLVGLVRDSLLTEYSGNENALEPFGFKVVIGTAASPKKTGGTPPA